MIEAKDKIANVFTVDSDVRVGSLPVDDFKKIMSDVKKDLDLHLRQLLVIGKMMFNVYFTTLKISIFILGSIFAIAFYFAGGGFDENAKDLYSIVMNGVPDDEVIIARKINWELITLFGMILNFSAQSSLFFGVTALIVTYASLFNGRLDIIEKTHNLACHLDALFLKIYGKTGGEKDIKNTKYTKRYCVFRSSGFLGYKNLFHEKAGLKIKSLLQEQTGEGIYVKIEDFS